MILGLIPARGGSKGIPRKNIRDLAGRPLLAWTAEVATASTVLHRVVLSTEDEEIASLGEELGLGVPFRRPAELAHDDTPMIDVVLHALDELRRSEGYVPDAVALLQPTAPHRDACHLEEAARLLEPGVDAVCSVSQVPLELSPDFLMKRDPDGFLRFFLPGGRRITRRQAVRPAFKRNGVIYLARREVIYQHRNLYGERCVPLVLPWEDAVTLDEERDWAVMERRLGAVSTDESQRAGADDRASM